MDLGAGSVYCGGWLYDKAAFCGTANIVTPDLIRGLASIVYDDPTKSLAPRQARGDDEAETKVKKTRISITVVIPAIAL
jgi:hypothetical protein